MISFQATMEVIDFVANYPNFLPIPFTGILFLFIFIFFFILVLLIGFLNFLLSAYRFLSNKARPFNIQINYQLWAQMIGVPAVMTLAFASNTPSVYFLAVAVLSTYIVADTNFIITLVAIIRNSKAYFEAARDARNQSGYNPETATISRENLNSVFDMIYSLIFGSQLRIMNELRLKGSSGLPSVLAEIEYKKTILPTVQPIFSFSQYMSFLIRNGLIESLPRENIYKITSLGEDFLIYIGKRGYPLDKPN